MIEVSEFPIAPTITDEEPANSFTFVEIESYENLRKKADLRERALVKLAQRVRDTEDKLTRSEDEVQSSHRQILIFKKDLAQVVDEKNAIQCATDEVALEKEGLAEVNEALHTQVVYL